MDRPTNPASSLPRTLSTRRCLNAIRPLLPIQNEMRGPSSGPSLPGPPRSFPDPAYTLSTHLVPAALPRSTPDVSLPHPPPTSTDKGKHDAAALEVANTIVSMRYKQWGGELNHPNSTRPLWVCLNRYVRREAIASDTSKGVTLLLLPANGSPKESWEPVILHMLEAQRQADSACLVDEIWAWEAVDHGDAAVVNQQNLTSISDCQDGARDVLKFLLHYMPERPAASALPTHLTRLPDNVASYRRSHGFQKRVIVGAGHSLGSCTLVRAAIEAPILFSSIILAEPAIVPYPRSGPIIDDRAFPYVVNAIKREGRWPSRDAARTALRASPFCRTWDPLAFENYIEHALCPDLGSPGGVRLKMSPVLEAVGFSDVLTMYETWDLLDQLDQRIELRFLMAGKHKAREGGIREMTVWRRPTNVSNVVVPGASHLIVQEAPRQIAMEIFNFVQRKYSGSTVFRL